MTTIVRSLAQRVSPGLPLDYRLLASFHFAEYVHELGGLAAQGDYPQLREAGRITHRASAFSGSPASFPSAIRAGVPGIPSGTLQ